MRKRFNFDIKNSFTSLGLDKKANHAIQEHFRLSNYQMLILSWFKGLWTGFLLSLILHYLINH